MKLDILKIDGQSSKKAELKDDIYGIEPNEHAIYLDVKQYLANQRQGTLSLKKELKLLVVLEKLKSKKAQVPLELVVLRRHCSKVEVVYSVLDQERMT